MIVEKQQGDTWGKSVVGNLADDLSKEFPATNGFSAANLWRMKNLYEVYGTDAKLAQLVREIGWSHNITILEKCKSEQEREFYIRSCGSLAGFGTSSFTRWMTPIRSVRARSSSRSL